MNERIQSADHTHEHVASRSEVLDSFAQKRAELESAVAELTSEPGFKMNAEEMIYHRRDLKKSQAMLDTFNEEYQNLGGAELDAAEAATDTLSFTSTAEDHIYTKARLRDAKNTFYENYLQSLENDEVASTPDEASEGVKLTTDPTTVDLGGAKPEETNNIITLDIVSKDGKVRVSRPDGKAIPENITVRTSSLGEKPVDSDETESVSKPAVVKTSPGADARAAKAAKDAQYKKEHPILGRIALAKPRIDEFTAKPLSFLQNRLQTLANARKQQKEATSDTKETKNDRKTRIFRSLGAVALVVASAGGSQLHGSEASAASPVQIPTAESSVAVDSALSMTVTEQSPESTPIEVQASQGWYDVFHDMGIPHDAWQDKLQKVGPELQAQGLAYWDGSNNEWRISAHDNFTLTADQAAYIKAA